MFIRNLSFVVSRCFVAVSILTASAVPLSAACCSEPSGKVQADREYGKLPLHFEANQGQASGEVTYLAQGRGYRLDFTPAGARLSLANGAAKTAALKINLAGSDQAATVTGTNGLPGKVNYLIGNDRAQWHRDIPTFGKVEYRAVYPGIDLVYYGQQGQLEYDFILAPGAEVAAIGIEFGGAESVQIDEASGDLLLSLPGGTEPIRWRKPVSYQEADGARQAVASEYVRREDGKIGFKVADYDQSRRLVIDPVLVYSTYLGGSAGDEALAIAVDSAGSAYITGYTVSADFPVTTGAFQAAHRGLNVPYSYWAPTQTTSVSNAFVTKLSPDGRTILYSTYLGGTGGPGHYGGFAGDAGYAVAVDGSGQAFVTGTTFSGDFPVTPGAYRLTGNNYYTDPIDGTRYWRLCGFGFLTKLNASGSDLIFSTYFGGQSVNGTAGTSMVLSPSGEAYVSGSTHALDYPATPGTVFPTAASAASPGSGGWGFLTKFNAAGSGLQYSTLLPNQGGLAVDAAGNAYVVGTTWRAGLPMTANAFQPNLHDIGNLSSHDDGYLLVLNASATQILYGTYIGSPGGNERAMAVALGSHGHVYVGGAEHNPSFPTTPGAYVESSPLSHTWVAKFDIHAATGAGSLIYSTLVAPLFSGWPTLDIALDEQENVYLATTADTGYLPVTADALQSTPHGPQFIGSHHNYYADEIYLAKLNASGSQLLYGSYFGGSGYDYLHGMTRAANGDLYLCGATKSTDFPLVPVDAAQTQFKGLFGRFSYEGRANGFVARLNLSSQTVTEPPGIGGGVPPNGSIWGTPDPLHPGQRTGTIGGTGHPGCTMEITVSDPDHESVANNSTYTTLVDADGNWSIALTLDDCHPTISIVQICDGIRSEPVSWQVVVDNTPPVFIGGGPGDATSYIGGDGVVRLPLDGRATDPDSHAPGELVYVWVLIGPGGEREVIGNGGMLELEAGPGEYDIEITVTDPAGNTLVKRCRLTVLKRPTTLDCAETAVNFGENVTLNATLFDGITNEPILGRTITYKLNGQPVSNPFSALLLPGEYVILAEFAGDDLYQPSTETHGCHITVSATPGKITGGGSIDERVRNFGFIAQVKTQKGATSFSGNLEFQDKSRGIDLKSASITMIAISPDRLHGVFTGTATNNKAQGYTFTVWIDDLAEPGAGVDKFRVEIKGPGGFHYDSASVATKGGILDKGGNIQIHKAQQP